MNRHVRTYVGWPKSMGPCLVEVSARTENYAVVLYQGRVSKNAFLIFQFWKVGVITRMWLMGSSPEEIHEAVMSESAIDVGSIVSCKIKSVNGMRSFKVRGKVVSMHGDIALVHHNQPWTKPRTSPIKISDLTLFKERKKCRGN